MQEDLPGKSRTRENLQGLPGAQPDAEGEDRLPPPPYHTGRCFLLVKFTLKPVGRGVGNAACRDQLPSRNQSRARAGAGRQGEIDTTED